MIGRTETITATSNQACDLRIWSPGRTRTCTYGLQDSSGSSTACWRVLSLHPWGRALSRGVKGWARWRDLGLASLWCWPRGRNQRVRRPGRGRGAGSHAPIRTPGRGRMTVESGPGCSVSSTAVLGVASQPRVPHSPKGLPLPESARPSFFCLMAAYLCVWRAARDSNPNRQIRSLVLCVDLDGSRRIWPAHVGDLVDLVGSRRVQLDRLDDQPDDQASQARSTAERGCVWAGCRPATLPGSVRSEGCCGLAGRVFIRLG